MFTGLEAVDFIVEDLSHSHTFLTTWGLRELPSDDGKLRFVTRDGGLVSAAQVRGDETPNARSVTWGVRAAQDLDALATRLEELNYPFERREDGSIALKDATGVQLYVVVSQRTPYEVVETLVNAPMAQRRVDQPGTFHKTATPLHIGHIVFVVPDVAQAEAFYTDVLGFYISDKYTGRATFLRSAARCEHHQLFLLKGDTSRAKFHHLAFLLTEIHEVFGGGLNVQRGGYSTRIGPGRHPISSVYFWYFNSPFAGGAFEYYADSDFVTEKWQPRMLEQRPDLFVEWALSEGLPEYKDVQKA